jgi:hypothetical protein
MCNSPDNKNCKSAGKVIDAGDVADQIREEYDGFWKEQTELPHDVAKLLVDLAHLAKDYNKHGGEMRDAITELIAGWIE